MKKTEYKYISYKDDLSNRRISTKVKSFRLNAEIIERLKKIEYEAIEVGHNSDAYRYAERRHKLEILSHINSKIN